MKNRLLFRTKCKEMQDKAIKSQSLDSSVAKAADLMDRVTAILASPTIAVVVFVVR